MTLAQLKIRSAYLAGPMRGIPEYNFPAFRQYTAILRNMGWTIFSPAERDEQDPDIDHETDVAGWNGSRGLDYFMAHDLKAVCEMDAVILMPGWQASQGARLEALVAVEVGHPVFAIGDEGTSALHLSHVSPAYVRAVFENRAPLSWSSFTDREESETQDIVDWLATNTTESKGTVADAWEALAREEPEDESLEAHTSVLRAADDPETGDQGYELPKDEWVGTAMWDFDETPLSPMPIGSQARKDVPLASGVLDYFPAALAEVAKVSKAGNDKHNPGQPLHHARGKSTDHADSLLRHLVDRGKLDAETGQRHSAEVAWRALALLQQELEDEGLSPLPRGARLPEPEDA